MTRPIILAGVTTSSIYKEEYTEETITKYNESTGVPYNYINKVVTKRLLGNVDITGCVRKPVATMTGFYPIIWYRIKTLLPFYYIDSDYIGEIVIDGYPEELPIELIANSLTEVKAKFYQLGFDVEPKLYLLQQD